MRYWRLPPGISDETKQQLAEMFGKTIWRFTDTHFLFQLDQSQFSKPYRVVAKDAISVVVAIGEEAEGSPTLQYIRFENDYLYILASNYNLEFFTRVGA